MWLQLGIINFDDFYFDVERYSVFRRKEVAAGNNIRQQACFILQFTASLLGSKDQLAPPTQNVWGKA